MKKAVLLVNLGTPERPEPESVRAYLKEFLSDPRVLSIPALPRKLLLHLVILPFRTPHSTRRYQQLWTPEGSPLAVHLEELTRKVRNRLAGRCEVFQAMRYGEPSLRKLLDELKDCSPEELVVVPLFPQFATSTTASIRDVVELSLAGWSQQPVLRFIEHFHTHPDYVRVMAEKIRLYAPDEYDAVLFSYHGIPYSQLKVQKEGPACKSCRAEEPLPVCGKTCYWAACRETTRLISKEAGLSEERVLTAFQSRLSNGWLKPFTDQVIADLPAKGIKKLLVVAPSFVADCLETTIELGVDYQRLFMEKGGQEYRVVDSLNEDAVWADALTTIATE